MRKQIKAHEERNVKSSAPAEPSSTPLPQYLLDRSQPTNAKALSSAIKNKRAEKAAKFSVPLPKVRGIAEEEMFKVVKTGKKTAKKGWKRMITKPTFGTMYSSLWMSSASQNTLADDAFCQLDRTLLGDLSSTSVLSDRWGCGTRRPTSPTLSSTLPSSSL